LSFSPPIRINQILYTNAQKIICELGVRRLLGTKIYSKEISWFSKLSVGRSGSPAIILRPFW